MTSPILITGGAGMVARNVIEHERASGHIILAPPRLELDLLDRNAVRRYLATHRPGMIVHIAGKVGGIEANRREPAAFLTANLTIGMNIVTVARELGIGSLLNLASSCMYPRDHLTPLTEDMILTGALEPTNEGYALAKIAVTRLCAYARAEDSALRYKTLIPCNIYGRYDNFDPIRSHLVPATLRKVWDAKRRKNADVDIWGDGTARREFMYAEDLADLVWECIERFEEMPGEMNGGLGHDYSVTDYYRSAAEIVGWSGSFRYDSSRPSGMARKLVDTSRQTAFGWKPKFTLSEGMRRTFEFLQTDATAVV